MDTYRFCQLSCFDIAGERKQDDKVDGRREKPRVIVVQEERGSAG